MRITSSRSIEQEQKEKPTEIRVEGSNKWVLLKPKDGDDLFRMSMIMETFVNIIFDKEGKHDEENFTD